MKNVEILTRTIPSKPRSDNYSVGGVVINTGGGTSSSGSDPTKLDKSVWAANFEELTDSNGSEYLYLSKPIVMAAGATMYAGKDILIPSIFDGLPLDQTSIGWRDGKLSVLGNIGGGISSAPVTGAGNAITSAFLSDDGKVLSLVKGATFLTEHQSLADYAKKTDIPSLTGYATESWVNNKGYLIATSQDKSNWNTAFGWGDHAGAGYAKKTDIPSLTGYATESWVNNKGYLIATSQDKSNWNTAFGWGDHAGAGYAKKTDLANYVTLATEQEITGAKTFTADTTAFKGITIGGVSVKKSEDGVLILDGNLLVTGGVTMHALGSRTAATIMDGVLVDGTTIVKENGKLVVVGGGGGLDTARMWAELGSAGSEQIAISHLTTALGGYIKKTGEGATGNWNISINGNAVYAPNSTRLYSSDSQHAYGGVSPYYMYMSYNCDTNRWKLKVNPATPEDIEVNYATSAGSAGSATTAAYLPTWYLGSVQNNPQTYFGGGIGLRVAMTGAWSVWSDTLWINGYSGGDVPYMCALHFLRNGTPRMAISTQTSTGTGYGGFYEVLTDYNYNSRCPTLSGGGASGTWGINITGISKGLESITTTTGNNMTDRPWQLWYWNQWVGDTAGIPASYMCGLNMRAQDANYGMQLGTTAFNDVLYFRKYNNGAYRPWRIIATTDSNVYSATKLQTARTIWGQPFDGTGNVEGVFRNVVNASSAIVHKTLIYPSAPFGLVTRVENNGDSTLQAQRESNNADVFNLILNPLGGNVGIGTTSPSYKLDVAGDIRLQAWIRTSGTYGWYNSTYDGGWHMVDANYVVAYNSKAVRVNNTTYWAFNSQGGYHSAASYGVGGTTWTDVSSYLDHIFTVANKYTPTVCYNRILGWADVMSGVGYQTRYGISSLRNGNQYGAMVLSITNNDAGTSGRQLTLYANGTMSWTGNLLLSGGATMHGSDITKKDIINHILLPLDKIANAPLIRYRWKDNRNTCTNIGGSAQYTNSLLPECAYKVGNTWSMDYATTAYAFAVSTAVHFADYIKKQATKEDARDIEIKELKQRIEILERRTA